MKKFVSLVLVLVTVFAFAIPAFAAVPEEVAPCYVNANIVKNTLTINSSGVATITLMCTASSTTTSISCTSYLEKKAGTSWVRIDITPTNDQWVDTVSSNIFSKSRTQQLNEAGDYRLTSIFTVEAATTETITLTKEATY